MCQGFNHFSGFLHHLVLPKLATSIIMVSLMHTSNDKKEEIDCDCCGTYRQHGVGVSVGVSVCVSCVVFIKSSVLALPPTRNVAIEQGWQGDDVVL